MHPALIKTVLNATGARSINRATVIQSLWSGYGKIVRLELEGSAHKSVILKHIKLPESEGHPRGWNTGLSHQRKVRSYQVEARWYQHYAEQCGADCPVPACLALSAHEDETVLVLTDLDTAGYHLRKEVVSIEDIRACLDWLAAFHATFIGSTPEGLWECGSYWHLDTRPDELAALEDDGLKAAAPFIDQALSSCSYQTLIHGDAKLANFCFSADLPRPVVAAVDFQYVGRGCGMKDVAYFIGSCLDDEECAARESSLLDFYFARLAHYVAGKQPDVDTQALVVQWRALFDVAWADFNRFLKGWSPGHWKLNRYSERLTQRVIKRFQ